MNTPEGYSPSTMEQNKDAFASALSGEINRQSERVRTVVVREANPMQIQQELDMDPEAVIVVGSGQLLEGAVQFGSSGIKAHSAMGAYGKAPIYMAEIGGEPIAYAISEDKLRKYVLTRGEMAA